MVCEVPIDAFSSKMQLKLKSSYLHVKVDKKWNISMNQIKDLEKQISHILQTSLHLLKVKDGCVELTFNPLRTVSGPFSQQQKKQLKELGALHLFIGENEIEFNLTDTKISVQEIAVALYKCPDCGSMWKSINSSGSAKQCLSCRCPYVEPYEMRPVKEKVRPLQSTPH